MRFLIPICFLLISTNLGFAQANRPNFWQHPEIRKCCSDADAIYTDDWTYLPDGSVRAVVTGTGPRSHKWAESLIGRVYIIPKEKVINLEGDFANRPGRPILFVPPWDVNHIYCFVPGPLI